MQDLSPIDQKQRAVVVDVLRGFALVGVIVANFTSYTDQLVPYELLQNLYEPTDVILVNFNSVFIEWKFMTLFSILFGYGFGLILRNLVQKGINPEPFFLRRCPAGRPRSRRDWPKCRPGDCIVRRARGGRCDE